VAKLKVLSRQLPRGSEKTTKSFSQDSRYESQDLNPEPSEYEAEELTTTSGLDRYERELFHPTVLLKPSLLCDYVTYFA
jgi:hypothetical protein